MERSLQFVAL